MSKKTFFERIASLAIAALGVGLLSSTPSTAAISGHTLYIGNSSTATTSTYSATVAINDTATAVVTHSFIASAASDSVVVSVSSNSAAHGGTLRFTLTDSSTGRSIVDEPTYTDTVASAAGVNNLITNLASGAETSLTSFVVSDSTITSTRSLNTTLSLRLIKPQKAGTYTFTVSTEGYQPAQGGYVAGPTVTFVVTVSAADVLATAASSSTLRAGTAQVGQGTGEGVDSAVFATRLTSGTAPAATIWVNQKNAAATANESMVVTVSGPAFLSGATDTSTRATAGSAITVKNKWLGQSYDTAYTPIMVWSTGTAGKATITVSSISGLVLGTEEVIFTGTLTSMKLDTTYAKILRAGGYAASTSEGNGTIDVFLSDANGYGVSGTITMISSNTSAVNSSATTAACTSYVSLGYPSLAGYYACDATTASTSTSGMTATLTYRVVNPAVTTSTEYFSVTHDVTLGGSVSTVSLTLDKTSYSPGEALVLSAKATDASGNPVYDGAAGPSGLTANKSLGTGSITMNKYYGGVSTSATRSASDPRVFRNTNNLFAPNASGTFSISGVYGTDNAKSLSVTGTVGDDAATAAANAASDAAAEAIDAANAATDAANLAAEAADAATVAAEEARDAADAATAAVEELATQVATLMAALKAQITTLANTVAKIAKKVKA